jgi:hypothetical protein
VVRVLSPGRLHAAVGRILAIPNDEAFFHGAGAWVPSFPRLKRSDMTTRLQPRMLFARGLPSGNIIHLAAWRR